MRARPSQSDGSEAGRAPTGSPAVGEPGGGQGNAAPDDDRPDVPGLRTWRAVYWFVLGCFVVTVLVLTVFTRVFA